jgi:hypothetical protein
LTFDQKEKIKEIFKKYQITDSTEIEERKTLMQEIQKHRRINTEKLPSGVKKEIKTPSVSRH